MMETASCGRPGIWCYGTFICAAAIIGAITGISIWIAGDEPASVGDEPASVGERECLLALKSSGFDFGDFGNYDTFFDSNSVMRLAEAGSYYGPAGIQEYILFAVASRFVISRIARTDTSFKMYDENTETCFFRMMAFADVTPNPDTTNNEINAFSFAGMYNVELDYSREIVSTINLYFTDMFLSLFFHELLNSDATRQYVCSVMNGSCGLQAEECETTLAALPLTTDGYVDGNSQGCRALHAVLATANLDHCAHLSFKPKEDPNGKIKCQESKGVLPQELFDSEDFASYEEFEVEVGIDPSVGYIEMGSQA